MKAVLLAARPRQWTKNLLIYVPLLFTAGDAWDFSDTAAALSLLVKATVAVVVFSLVSSGQYMVNDVLDVEEDRRHARKRHRPVASGALTPAVALMVGGLLAAGGTAGAFVLEPAFGWVTAIYLATAAAYSFALKRIALLDVFVISAGFVLRTVAGAAVLGVPVSPWLYTCAGLDVTSPEPPEADSPLRTLPNVVLTPHIAGAKSFRTGAMAAEELCRFFEGRPQIHQVTRDMLPVIA